MSEQENCMDLTSKSQVNSNPKHPKRPANSPLNDNIECISESSADSTRENHASGQPGIHKAFSIGLDSGQSRAQSGVLKVKRKRIKAMSKQINKQQEEDTAFLFPFACTPNTTSVFSNYQQSPFTMSQPAFIQSGSPSHYGYPLPPPTPPWAAKIISDMSEFRSELKSKFETIDNINKTVTSINSKVSTLEAKYKSLEKRVVDTEKSCDFQARLYEESSSQAKAAQDQIKILKKQCDNLVSKTNTLRDEKETMETKLDSLECQSLKNDLIFYGLPETEMENCVSTIKELCTKVLDIQSANNHLVEKAFRIGRRSQGKPRPILATYHYNAEREEVRLKSYDKADDLKKAGYGVGINLPKAVRDARRTLYEPRQAAKQEGKRVKFVGKRLYINDTLYRPNADN